MQTHILAHSGVDHNLEGQGHPSFLAEHGLHLVLAGVFFLAYLSFLARELWFARRSQRR